MGTDISVQPGTLTQAELAATQQAAQQAYAQNLAWRAVNAPETLSSTEQQYASSYRDAMDAAREQQKHDIAFSQPRSDIPQAGQQGSSRYEEILAQYAAQQNRVVSSGGHVYQGKVSSARNPYPEDTAAGIAWKVAQTGDASDYFLNLKAEAEIRSVGGDAGFIRYATDIYAERPSFAREDITTPSGQYFVNQEWSGVPIRLNLTREEIAAGGPINASNYQKFYKYDSDTRMLERLGEGGYSIGVDIGVHKAPGDWGGPLIDKTTGAYGGWQPRISGTKVVAAVERGIPVQEGVDVRVPVGSGERILHNAKVAVDQRTGEIAIYQKDMLGRWGLVGGAGRNAAQSEEFYVSPPSAMGKVNLASFSAPVALGKAEAPGVDIPWNISQKTAAVSFMDQSGITKAVPGYETGRIKGETTVAATTREIPQVQDQTNIVMRPSDFDLWAANLNIPVVSGALVATSDFLFSGTGPLAGAAKGVADVTAMAGFGRGGEATFTRYNIETTIGKEVMGQVKTEYGAPVVDVHDLGGGVYERVVYTPSTTTTTGYTPITTKMVPLQGGFEYGEEQFSKAITQKLPEVGAFGKGTPWEYNIELARGAYMELREKPLTAAVNVGIGAGIAAASEVIVGYSAATVVATAGTRLAPIALGTEWFATKAAPVALTALYGTSVAGRATDWGRDFTPAATYKLGGILSTETGPMFLGGGAFAYRAEIGSAARSLYREVPSRADIGEFATGGFYKIRDTIAETRYSFEQGRMDIKNIGVGGGKGFDVFNEFESAAGARAQPATIRSLEAGRFAEEPRVTPETFAKYESFINEYSTGRFTYINRLMRSEMDTGVNIGQMFETMSIKGQAPDVLYRGVGGGKTASSIREMGYGDIYSDLGLQSFTSSKYIGSVFARETGVILRYHPEVGEPIIRPSKPLKPIEEEYILKPGEFTIIGKTTEYAGYTDEIMGYSHLRKVEIFDIARSKPSRSISEMPMKIEPYNPMGYMQFERPLLETTKQVSVPELIQIRETRISGYEFGKGTESLIQDIRFTGDITAERTAKFEYATGKLQEPLYTGEAWSGARSGGVTAKTTTVATLDPYSGIFSAFTTKSFDITPAPKTMPKGFEGEQFGYQLNIYDLPMRIEQIGGKGTGPTQQISAMTKAIVGEERPMGTVGVEATRQVGEFGTVSRTFTQKGVVDVLESVKTKEIGKAFESIVEAEKPVDIAFKFEKGTPSKRISQKAKKPAKESFVTPQTFEVPKQFTRAEPVVGRKGGTILEEPTVLPSEKISSITRNIIEDITPAKERVLQTPESAAKAMKAAQVAHQKTIAKNTKQFEKMFGPTDVGGGFAEPGILSVLRKTTPASRELAMKKATAASLATQARNKEFVGKQIDDILSGRTAVTKEMEPIVSTYESRIYSEAMFRAARSKSSVIDELSMERVVPVEFARGTMETPIERQMRISRTREISVAAETSRRDVMKDIASMDIVASRSVASEDIIRSSGGSMGIDISRILERGPVEEIIPSRKTWEDVIQRTDIRQDVRQITDVVSVPYIYEGGGGFEEIIKIPPPPVIPPIGIGMGGGAGGWPMGSYRTSKYQYQNPVVDIKYLSALSGFFGAKGHRPTAVRATPLRKSKKKRK